jgi:hypothetical protein
MREYEIWIEGYRTNGESAKASLIGKSFGNNFDEACLNFTYPADLIGEDGTVYAFKGERLVLDRLLDGSYQRGPARHDPGPSIERLNAVGNYCIWQCQLFDNWKDAAASFG